MGKGGGPLSVWLKEFTALVFTQTIQAFIYAIVISIILFGMQSRANVSAADNNSALGLMATFALLSVFKVEEMAKKIFGVGDTKASHKNAMKSIAKTAIAAKLGSKVLNNTGKILGGTKAVVQSRFDKGKLKSDMKKEMDGINKKGKPTASGSSSGASSNGNMSDAQKKYYDKAIKAKASGDMAGYKKYMEQASLARTIEKSAGGFGGGGSAAASGSESDTKQKMESALKVYRDKLDDINKARDQGIKNIASGITEFAGSIVGATAGGILGGADGNLDEALQGMLAGAGVGDMAGKSAIDGLERTLSFATRNIKRKRDGETMATTRGLKQTIKEYENAIKEYENNIKDVGNI